MPQARGPSIWIGKFRVDKSWQPRVISISPLAMPLALDWGSIGLRINFKIFTKNSFLFTKILKHNKIIEQQTGLF